MNEAPTPRTRSQVSALLIISALAAGCASRGGRTEEVSFAGSGGTVLRGTLALPGIGSEGLPAVVLLHGSERATRKRSVYAVEAKVFLARGFAVLVYDKRGAGESGGSFDETTYSQLVDDALGAVLFLRARREIDPSRIGLIGASESGWLTPEIAERSGGLAFVVNKSGPAVSWRETVAWEIYNDLLADGVDERSAREQMELRRRIWEYYLRPTSEERVSLDQVLSAWAGRKDSRLPLALEDEVSASYLARIGYDPLPFLERSSTPMLYVFGRRDVNVPIDACIARLRELAEAGKPFSYHVFENAGHQLGGIGLLPPGYHLLEGYAELVGDFAVAQAGR